MPHPIQIPRLGWSMEQGTFVGWLKKSGDNVQPGDPLFTLEGEKAIQEIEAVDAGTLHFDAASPAEGDIVAVNAVIGYLLAVGETSPPIPARQAPTASTQQSTATLKRTDSGPNPSRNSPQPSISATRAIAPPASPAVRRLARQLGVDLSPLISAGRISEADVCRRYLQGRGDLLPGMTDVRSNSQSVHAQRVSDVPRRSRQLPTISPRAAHTATRLGIDWTQLQGSGSQGRIRERDVLAVADNFATAPNGAPAATQTIPMTPLRRTIANRMVSSLHQTAPVTLTSQIDVTAVFGFREQLKQSGASLIPSVTDCFVKLTAVALRECPLLNARWHDTVIEAFDEIHIGIAVETAEGLLVPVIRNAHHQSVFEIAGQSQALIEKARSRQLTANEMQGGTFTITNLGSFGIDAFTPIINFPETAILGLGQIQATSATSPSSLQRPRYLMTLSLTFDHRVLDGAPAARFLQTMSRLTATESQQLFEPNSRS